MASASSYSSRLMISLPRSRLQQLPGRNLLTLLQKRELCIGFVLMKCLMITPMNKSSFALTDRCETMMESSKMKRNDARMPRLMREEYSRAVRDLRL